MQHLPQKLEAHLKGLASFLSLRIRLEVQRQVQAQVSKSGDLRYLGEVETNPSLPSSSMWMSMVASLSWNSRWTKHTWNEFDCQSMSQKDPFFSEPHIESRWVRGHSSIQKMTLTRDQSDQWPPSTNLCAPLWRLKWFRTPHSSAEPGQRGSNREPPSDPKWRVLGGRDVLPWKKPTSKWQNTTHSWKNSPNTKGNPERK